MPLYSKTGEVKYTTRRPIVYPAGKWDKDTTYIANSFSCPQVEHEGQYYVLNRLGECIGVNPKESSASNDGIWILMDKMQYLFTEVLMAEFAKLASAIYWGDYTFSQYGKDASGGSTTDYSKFDPTKIGQSDCPFTPNLMIDWLLGKLIGMDMDIRGGKVGALKIEGNKLSSSDPESGIEIGLDGLLNYLRLGGSLEEIIKIGISGAGEKRTGLSIYSQVAGNTCMKLWGQAGARALDSIGSCKWELRSGEEWIMPGMLYGCEIYTNRNNQSSKVREWGNGLGTVTFNYDSGQREYYFNFERVTNDLFFVPISNYRRESTAFGGSTGSYNFDQPNKRLTVVFWEGSGKVYPEYFQLTIFGRPDLIIK